MASIDIFDLVTDCIIPFKSYKCLLVPSTHQYPSFLSVHCGRLEDPNYFFSPNFDILKIVQGTVVTHLPSTSEVGGSNPGPYVGKLIIVYGL